MKSGHIFFMSMSNPLDRLCSNNPPITQTDIDNDLNLRRVHESIVHMRRNMYAPIKYHGKMRHSDVLDVEILRKKHRKDFEKEISRVNSVSLSELRVAE